MHGHSPSHWWGSSPAYFFGRVAAFLCSEYAGYVTGTATPVDGGTDAGLL